MRSIGPVEILATLTWLLFWFLGCGGMFWLFVFLRNRANQRRLEMIHQERMVAMEKGVPLPELPDLEPRRRNHVPKRSTAMLAGGIICISLGAGGIVALQLSPVESVHDFWTLPLPLIFLGLGLLLYHFLTRDRSEQN